MISSHGSDFWFSNTIRPSKWNSRWTVRVECGPPSGVSRTLSRDMFSRYNVHVAFALATARSTALGLHCRPLVDSARLVMTVASGPKRRQLTGRDCRMDECLKPFGGCYASSWGRQSLPPSSPSPPPPPVQPQKPPSMDDDRSQSVFQRFKNVIKKYWYIALPVHLVTSTLWFGSFYLIASSGVDIPALLKCLGIPEWIIDKVRNGSSWTSYLIISYGLYKIFTPLRYMVTLGGTGITIRYLQKLGYAVGPPKKPS